MTFHLFYPRYLLHSLRPRGHRSQLIRERLLLHPTDGIPFIPAQQADAPFLERPRGFREDLGAGRERRGEFVQDGRRQDEFFEGVVVCVEEFLRVRSGPVEDFCRAVGDGPGDGAAVVDVGIEDPDVQSRSGGERGAVEDEFAGGEGLDREEELRVDEDRGVETLELRVGSAAHGEAGFEEFDGVQSGVSRAQDAGAAFAFQNRRVLARVELGGLERERESAMMFLKLCRRSVGLETEG